MYTILKKITLTMKALHQTLTTLYQISTDSSTLANGYVIFPNGLKICWGHFYGKKTGDIITLPISFQSSKVAILPEYSYYESWMAHYSCNSISNSNQFTLYAFDISTHSGSTSTNLSGIYLVIGY